MLSLESSLMTASAMVKAGRKAVVSSSYSR